MDAYVHADAVSDSCANGYTYSNSRAGDGGHAYRYTLASTFADGHCPTRSDGHTHTYRYARADLCANEWLELSQRRFDRRPLRAKFALGLFAFQ